MAKVKIDAKSLDKLQAQMKAAPRQVRSAYRKGLKDVGKVIADDAKARIVEKSPETARTIKVRTRMPATVIVQGGEKDKPIGKLLEGTRSDGPFWTHPLFGDEKRKYVEARVPHLRPAFDAHKDDTKQALHDQVIKGLEEIDLHADDD